MASFTQQLLDIHQQISIKDEDRQPYTEMFDIVKNWLFKSMCQIDPVFEKLYKGTCLFGSYSNNVRILKPNEFDTLFLLQFPCPINFDMDHNIPGYVHINLKNVLAKLSEDRNYIDVLNKFRSLCNNEGKLESEKFRFWLSDIMEKVLNGPKPNGYSIQYSNRNVALNIYASEQKAPFKKISFDFVPAIKIDKASAKSHLKHYSQYEEKHFENFYAVPASFKYRVGLYQIVNPMAERDLLWNKQNLKIVYRLLKSLRDQYELDRLKSYYLTAIFLWEVLKQKDDQFWKQPVGVIFLHMLEKLHTYFANGELPYFWADGFNLLKTLKPTEVAEYTAKLDGALKQLKVIANKHILSYKEVAAHFDIELVKGKNKKA